MAKLVWRVKLIAELGSGILSETEVARIERDDFAVAETVGLTLDEGKRLAAAAQAEIVRAQVAAMGERFRWCEHCGAKLVSKGYYPATFRSVFGDVAVRVRRLCACRCRAGMQEPKSFSALAATDGVAPELAYITAKFAALAPFARVADLLSELLPIGGAANAGTVRNRTMRVGATVTKLTPACAPMLDADAVTPAVIVGLDGGYVRSRHRRPERNFEVIAGKVLDAEGVQHRFCLRPQWRVCGAVRTCAGAGWRARPYAGHRAVGRRHRIAEPPNSRASQGNRCVGLVPYRHAFRARPERCDRSRSGHS